MNLYIEVENGQSKNHPAFEDNIIEAFGAIPECWEPFVRVAEPVPEQYQVFNEPKHVYQKVSGVWTDVWALRDMTTEEISAKQQAMRQEVIDIFNAHPQAENWSTWTFDEATFKMQPPIPRLAVDQTKVDAGIRTVWCGAENNWKDTPACPIDGNQYKFDYFAWQWVLDVN
jgi:hypothetical protein